MKIRMICWFLTVFVVAFILFGVENLLLQNDIADNTVRLHVVANSDSQEDQAHKLVVRDAVVNKVSELTSQCADAKEAELTIEANLQSIAEAAAQVSDQRIEVQFMTEAFDTRYYDTFTLPAGNYRALRVNIGNAEGKNWWCVVFPSLCTAATTEAVAECAGLGGFDEGQTDLILGGEEEYTYRFKTLQWLKDLFGM